MNRDNGNRVDLKKARELSTLPTAEFAKLIESVVLSCGGTPASARRASSNAGALQRMLASASEADLARLFAQLGPQAKKIVEEQSFQGGGNAGGVR